MVRNGFKLVGVTIDDAQRNIKKFGCRDIGSFALIREPDNPHDSNAIRVELAAVDVSFIIAGILPDDGEVVSLRNG